MALGSTQPLTEMSKERFLGEQKGGRRCMADNFAANLAAICKPIV
jgi:hypothetical protein